MKTPSFIDALTNRFNRLSQGGDRPGKSGESPLYAAVKAGNRTRVRLLLRAGSNPNRRGPDGATALHEAAYWGEAGIVDLLLAHGADPNIVDAHGWTPLHAAAVTGGEKARATIIARLKAGGADESVKDNQGWTARDYMALWEDNPAAAERLRLLTTGRQKLDPPPPRAAGVVLH